MTTSPNSGSRAVPHRLRTGDRVRFVSPASTPDRQEVERGVQLLSSWGLSVEVADHAFDTYGSYLAGRDEDRISDLNDALRDPGVRAILATTGGKGAYRVAHALDFDAASHDPKPFVGFSETTIIHLALWMHCNLAGFHGPHMGWSDYNGVSSAESLRCSLMEPAPMTINRDPGELTAKVAVGGTATGALIGGNLDMIRTSIGWACPSFDGAILFVEAVDMPIGAIDRTFTQLINSGLLNGLKGVAIGQFIRSGEEEPGKWSAVDVLYDRLAPLGVPVLGGLPIGHGPKQPTVPLGTTARIDAAAGTLTIAPGVS